MTDLFKKTAIFSLSVITAIGMMGAVAAPSTANAQSLSSSQIDSIISLLQSFGADQNTIDNVEASLMGEAPSGNTGSDSGSTATKCDFNRDLSTGSQGSDVKCLQEYLNNAGYTVANSGPGSPGNETSYFGSLTKQAVVAWQNANAAQVLQPVGLSSGTGYWGQSSISYYNQVAAGTGSGTGDTGDTGADTPDSGVSVSTNVMESVTVPKNANLINLGEFKFASGEDTTIEGLNFERKGAGVRGDWDNLYVYEGSERLTSGRTINSNQGLDFSNLDVDLDDGEAKTLTLKGTVSSSNQGNVHYFQLESADFGDSVDVSGLPLKTRTITISGVSAGSLDVSRNSTINSTVKLGDDKVEVFNATLTASNEDMDLERVMLNQYGSINIEELENFSVELEGSEEDADINVDGDEISVEFDDSYYLEDGDTVEFALYADMTSEAYIKGGSGTIDLNVDEGNDIFAVGQDYGYGVNVTSNNFGNIAGDQITLNASELNFSFNGPQTGDIGLNAEDVVLFDADVAAQADYEVENLSFDLAFHNSNKTHLQNLKLVNGDTGEVYAGPDEISAATGTQTHTFDDTFIIEEGDSTIQLVSDIGNNTENNAEITVTMLIDKNGDGNVDSSDLDAENLNTSESVDLSNDVIPAGTLAGKKQTVTQPDLTISNSPTPTGQTYVVGKSDTIIGAYVLEASDVSSIDVRQLDFSVTVSTGTVSGLTGSFDLYKDSVSSGNIIDSKSSDSSATDSVSFDTSGELDLPANEQTTVYLVASIKSDAPTDGSDTVTTTMTSVSAKDDENNDPLFNGGSTFSDVSGNTFTIASSGSFDDVEFSGNNPSENQVIVPGSDVLFSSYRLRPTNEDIQMRDFVASIADQTEAKYFDSVKAFVDGSQVASKVITTSTKKFDNVNIDLTKDVDTQFDFKATLVDNFTNLTSGQELQLYFATSTSNYDIVGLDSGASVTFPTSSIDEAGDGLRTYQIANSYPTFTFTGSDSTLTAGTKNLYKFDVTANNDAVEIRELTFDVQVNEGSSSTNGNLQVDSFELLKNGTVVGTASTTSSDGDGIIGETADGGSETASTTININSVSDYTIGSGNTVTFTLRGNVTGVGSDDANSISVNLDDSDEDAAYSRDTATSNVSGNTVWGDSYRYFNGTYLDYPTDTQTLSL